MDRGLNVYSYWILVALFHKSHLTNLITLLWAYIINRFMVASTNPLVHQYEHI